MFVGSAEFEYNKLSNYDIIQQFRAEPQFQLNYCLPKKTANLAVVNDVRAAVATALPGP